MLQGRDAVVVDVRVVVRSFLRRLAVRLLGSYQTFDHQKHNFSFELLLSSTTTFAKLLRKFLIYMLNNVGQG